MNLDELISFLVAGRDLKKSVDAKIVVMTPSGVPLPLENVTMNADGSMNFWPEGSQ